MEGLARGGAGAVGRDFGRRRRRGAARLAQVGTPRVFERVCLSVGLSLLSLLCRFALSVSCLSQSEREGAKSARAPSSLVLFFLSRIAPGLLFCLLLERATPSGIKTGITTRTCWRRWSSARRTTTVARARRRRVRTSLRANVQRQ